MKKITIIIGIFTLTVGLFADVPYIFKANTPAKASEVNANFQALSTKITNVENVVGIGGDDQGTSSGCDSSPFPYTYQYTPSQIGDTITVRGVEYIIVALPFIEHGTGEHFYIKKPVIKTYSSNNIDLRIYLDTEFVNKGTSCYPSSFSGYPAQYSEGIRYGHNYQASIADPANNGSKFTINKSAYNSVRVKINQTTFGIYVGLNQTVQDTSMTSGDVDLRDNINWSSLGVDTSLVNDLKTLFNYVEIVKIP